MKATLAGNILLSGVCGVFLTGCSTVVNSHLQKEDMMTAYENGNNAEVMQEIEYKLREPRWFNSSVVNTGDEVMWRLEAGSMNFHQGKFDECIKQLKIAERLIGEYDDRAMLSARDVGAEAGICFALVPKLLGGLLVQVQALGLGVGAKIAAHLGTLVPVQAQPTHGAQDDLRVLVGGAGGVGVVDAQDERAAVCAGESPVIDSGAGAADVQLARR